MSLRAVLAALGAVTVAAAVAIPASAGTTPRLAAAGPADYCLGQCADVLPPGQNGNASLLDIIGNQVGGSLPAHAGDQLGKYADLVYNYAGLTDNQIGAYYGDAGLGVAPGQAERTYSPRSDVTVVRDKQTGTPHVTGTTRAGTMYGAGYVGAEDRLFTMDLLRHVGRGTLTSFAGGNAGNKALEQSLWRSAPYTEDDLTAQVDALRTRGDRGEQLYQDLTAYLAGVNAYIDKCAGGNSCPGEYTLANAGTPQHFTLNDMIAVAAVIGGLFGGGGGNEMESALVRVAARARYGTAEGDRVWQQFRSQNDPATVLTLHDGQSFPYGLSGGDGGVVLPDAGSVRAEPVTAPATALRAATPQVTDPSTGQDVHIDPFPDLTGVSLDADRGMSNAVVVSGAATTDGHPVAVFGPQTGYFAPQLLMTQELQGPGISARGVAFAGLNLYVLLGRGQDYAWSATSSEHDITDTYALPLCTTDGSPVTLSADHYTYDGQCLAMEELSHVNSWKPSTADSTAAGSYKLIAHRTRLGLVAWRGTVGGRPYAFTELRSTYRHEAEPAIGFQMFNDPSAMADADSFQAAASNVDFAFNWFYVNSRQSAYFDSGRNPVRAAGADPNLPMRGDPAYLWQNYNPADNTSDDLPAAAHPRSTDQDYYVSWNNKQAGDFSAADGNFSYGSVQRAELLDDQVGPAVRSGRKLSRADVATMVEKAAVTDLRAVKVLDELIQVLQTAPVTDTTVQDAVAKLRAWRAAGGLRVETAKGSKVYQNADAIRILDAWWPLLVQGEFQPSLGTDLFQSLLNAMKINESPSAGQRGPAATLGAGTEAPRTHAGSAFQFGWWSYVDQDIRTVLDSAAGTAFCGGGTVAGCREVLTDTLRTAAQQSAATVYPADGVCAAGDQWCADAIRQSPLGGIKQPLIAWQNRPTYQQVVSFPSGRADGVAPANLALGATATASGTQSGNPASAAVDGNPATRWASSWADGQWLQVDLGSARTVSRVLLSWESAYASSYRVDVSTDGSTWQTVATVPTSDGARDTVSFPTTTARYVKLTALSRATSYGISLYEFAVYAS
jgi:acyl-homoserine lactone acylase PvdQ